MDDILLDIHKLSLSISQRQPLNPDNIVRYADFLSQLETSPLDLSGLETLANSAHQLTPVITCLIQRYQSLPDNSSDLVNIKTYLSTIDAFLLQYEHLQNIAQARIQTTHAVQDAISSIYHSVTGPNNNPLPNNPVVSTNVSPNSNVSQSNGSNSNVTESNNPSNNGPLWVIGIFLLIVLIVGITWYLTRCGMK